MPRSSLRIIDSIKVATPCVADWDLMVGDDRQRFCKACEKHVYNLPLLTEEELVDLIERTEGQFCGRLYARTDGTVLTNDCPIGLAAKLAETRRNRRMGAAAAVTALMLAAGGLVLGASFGGATISPMVAGGIQPMPPPQEVKGEIMIVEQPEQAPQPEMIKEQPKPRPHRRKTLGKIKVSRD
jgi:hypothetical protein